VVGPPKACAHPGPAPGEARLLPGVCRLGIPHPPRPQSPYRTDASSQGATGAEPDSAGGLPLCGRDAAAQWCRAVAAGVQADRGAWPPPETPGPTVSAPLGGHICMKITKGMRYGGWDGCNPLAHAEASCWAPALSEAS